MVYEVDQAVARVVTGVCLGRGIDLGTADGELGAIKASVLQAIIGGVAFPHEFHEQIVQLEHDYASCLRREVDAYPCVMSEFGLRLSRCRITGPLELSNLRTHGGGAIPPLVFQECVFDGQFRRDEATPDEDFPCIDLRQSRLTYLSLRGSRFRYFCADEAAIHGTVDCSHVGPLKDLSEFSGYRETLLELIDNSGAEISAQANQVEKQWQDKPPTCGDASLGDRGGVELPEFPLLKEEMVCRISMNSATIEGDLYLNNVSLGVPAARNKKDYDYLCARFALKLQGTQIGGSLKANGRSSFIGGMCLYLAAIEREIWLGGALLVAREGAAFDGQSVSASGIYAVGSPLRAVGVFSLSSAEITGHVNIPKARLLGCDQVGAYFANSEISGFLCLGEQAIVCGGLDLNRAQIGMDLDLSDSIFLSRRGSNPKSFVPAIDLEGISVDGSITLAKSVAVGHLNAVNLKCQGDIDLNGTSLLSMGPPLGKLSYALLGMDMDIYGSVLFSGSFIACGQVSLQRTKVAKDLAVFEATLIGGHADERSIRALDISWSHIGGNLILAKCCVHGRIDLSHAFATTLSDQMSGYVDAFGDGTGLCPVELRGLEYKGLLSANMKAHEDDENPADALQWEHDIVSARISWLSAMPEYNPQPYVQLAEILHQSGVEDAAREILVRKKYRDLEQRRRRIGKRGVLKGVGDAATYVSNLLFGWLFDFGLGANKAVATLAASFVIGWLVFSLALARGAMIVDQQPVAGSVENNRLGAVMQGAVESDVNCGDSVRPSLYALDVFIPLVDLRQESECEIGQANDAAQLLPGVLLAGDVRWLPEVELYKYFKALYAVFGWVFISLSILTFSGILRP